MTIATPAQRRSRAHMSSLLGASLFGVMLMAGCSSSVPVEQMATDEEEAAATANAAQTADDAAENAAEAAADADATAALPALMPPEPGTPGGLPADRTPLNEGDKDMSGQYGAGLVVEKYAGLIEQGRYPEAYALWADKGAGSGVDEAGFAASFDQYSERHVQIGRPQVKALGGQTVATVPVQIYGRVAATGKPFNLYGPVTLVRVEADPKVAGSSQRWEISKAALDAIGTVKEAPVQP